MWSLFKARILPDKKYEKLSAYLDNELSEQDVNKIEEELKFSKELQEKFAELKKIKQLTFESVKSIPENPFFETKLAAALKIRNPWYFSFRKFSPVYGIVILCIGLMIILKYNPKIVDKVIDQQKTNLAEFYKQNLKPLLYTANLTNNDIFNFAFYHQLPLDDQKKQYLTLGTDKNGKDYFEIKSAGVTESSSNLENFVKKMNMTPEQKLCLDSILASHAKDMQCQILVNKDTIAINPNIWNFNKALTADLITYAEKVNKKEFQKNTLPIRDQINNLKAFSQLVKNSKKMKSDKYIFLTQDSIYSEQYHFDQDEFNNDMAKWSAEMNNNFKEIGKQFKNFNVKVNFGDNFAKLKRDSSWDKNFNVYIDNDNNVCRVNIPQIDIPEIVVPNLDKLTIDLNRIAEQFKNFSFNIPNTGKGKNYKYNYLYSDSSKGFNFNFKAYGFDSSFTTGNPRADSLLKRRFKKFSFNPDSMASFFKYYITDSSGIHQQKEMQEQMKDFEKQMELFQKQMERMQKDLQKSLPKTTTKKPVEI